MVGCRGQHGQQVERAGAQRGGPAVDEQAALGRLQQKAPVRAEAERDRGELQGPPPAAG